jgi:hypothetical protein
MVKRLQFLLGKHDVNADLGVRDADPVYTAIALNKANRVSNRPPLPSRLLPRLGQFPRVGPVDRIDRTPANHRSRSPHGG